MRPQASLYLLTCLTLAVSACTEPPDFDKGAQLRASRIYPTIQPLGEVLAVGADPATTEADSAALQARADALRARAAAVPPEPVDPLLLKKARGQPAQP